jgi:hypothetical protein
MPKRACAKWISFVAAAWPPHGATGSHANGLTELAAADPFTQTLKLFVILEVHNKFAPSPTIMCQRHAKSQRGAKFLFQ